MSDNKEITIQDLLSKQEDLHEDLLPYLDTNDNQMFHTLRHPLVYSVPYVPAYNALLNKRYELLSKDIKKHLEKKEYSSYVFTHERPYRLWAFLELDLVELSDKEYWELLAEIWIDSENIWQNIKTWRKLFKLRKASKHLFMSKKDKKHFDTLPDKIMVYRGYLVGKNEFGLSYTTDLKKAEWFSKRYNKDGKVTSRYINKKYVLAYTNERSENEIIILKK